MSEHPTYQRLPPLQKQLEGRTPSAVTEREQPENTGQGRLAGHNKVTKKRLPNSAHCTLGREGGGGVHTCELAG